MPVIGAVPPAYAGAGSGGQAEMGENLRNHGGIFDSGNDLQVVATMGAMFHVDIEHPFE